MLVGDALGQARLGVCDAIRPLVEHLDRSGANPAILGLEQLVEQRIVNQIQSLINPQCLKLSLLVRLRCRPFFQIGQHLAGTALLENTPGLFAVKTVRRSEHCQEGAVVEAGEVCFFNEWPLLDRHTPDAAVDVVAAFVAEVHLAVLDDGVRPVGDVQRSIGAELDVDRAKINTARTQHIRHLLSDVTRVLVADLEPDNTMRAKVAGDRVALPVVREVRAADDLEAAEFRVTPRAHAVEQLGCAGVREIHRARHAVAEPLPAGAVSDKGLAERIVVVPPRIAEAAQENLSFERLGSQSPHAAALEAQHIVRRLHVRPDVNRLVEVQPPIEAPAQRVQNVVRVLGAETGHHHAGLVGLAIAVGIPQMKQLGTLGNINPAVARLDAGRDQQVIGKDG